MLKGFIYRQLLLQVLDAVSCAPVLAPSWVTTLATQSRMLRSSLTDTRADIWGRYSHFNGALACSRLHLPGRCTAFEVCHLEDGIPFAVYVVLD